MRSLRDRLEAMQPEPMREPRREPVGTPVELIAPGIERVNEHGAYYLVETRVPDPTAGQMPVRDPLLPASLREPGGTSPNLSHEHMLFLDTETTGLERGAGTSVFLVGVGFFDGPEFTVQQYFIRDLYEEASLLHDLSRLIGEFPVMVSFNGRAFDWPMLFNRFILHGHRDLPEFVHWDLLAFARRIWKHRLRDCSLGNLERQLLGLERFGDVPGYLIPQIYFDYLHTRDARPLKPVFTHNQEDVVSLARLADLILDAEADPQRVLVYGTDRLSFGLHLLASGNLEAASSLLLACLDDQHSHLELRGRAYRSLAAEYRRRGSWNKATELWERMSGQSWSEPDHALYPLIELAKYYEHRRRDFQSAIRLTVRALNMAELRGWQMYHVELHHRYARLLRKMGFPAGNRFEHSIVQREDK